MSAVEESKSTRVDVSTGKGHGAVRISSDSWGVILSFVETRSAVALSTTASWLRGVVHRCIRSITVDGNAAALSAARFTALQDVTLSSSVDLSVALPVLREHCPQLSKLAASCDGGGGDALISNLPLFPKLKAVHLWRFDAAIAKALACCPELVEVSYMLGMRPEASVLPELSAMPRLRKLRGVSLRDEDEVRLFCSCVGSWSQLEELDLRIGMRDVPIVGCVAAIADSCPALRSLALGGPGGLPILTSEEATALGRLSQLRVLRLNRLLLPATFFDALGEKINRLETLELLSDMLGDGSGWNPLGDFVARQQSLKVLQVDAKAAYLSSPGAYLPATALLPLLRAVARHPCLTRATIASVKQSLSSEDAAAVAVDLAEAVVQSRVTHWACDARFDLLAFLRAWRARQPAAAIRKMNFCDCECEGADGEEGFTSLLLSCLRSCPSLRLVVLGFREAEEELTAALVKAVKAQPVKPMILEMTVYDVEPDLMEEAYDTGLEFAE
eukprot:PLAT15475.1.p1 GENE.PLAT15475.1~~PLAT15475.1.p1  ORF type:complete len:501 (+),score=92.21 PLAT15475.1:328-1830(+)